MNSKLSASDIKYFFDKHKRFLFWLMVFCVIGFLTAIIISISSSSYLNILNSSDKIFYDYVKGNVDLGKQTYALIFKNLAFELIIFLLCLNYYLGLATFLFVSYQSANLLLLVVAVIGEFGFGGVLASLFLILPINLINLTCNLIFTSVCLERSKNALRFKQFSFGFNSKQFWLPSLLLICFCIVFSCAINLILLVILRSQIFAIF